MNVLIILTILITVSIFISAIQNKVLREIGFRNIFRRKTTTVLVILGSMIGTALIAGSLTLGDSFNNSTRVQAEKTLGEIDVEIRVSNIGGIRPGLSVQNSNNLLITEDEANQLTSKFDENKVDGTLNALIYTTSLVKGNDAKKDLSMSNVDIIAFKNTKFGSEDINYNIEYGKAIISKDVADRLDLKKGDVFISYNSLKNITLEVQDINNEKGAGNYSRRDGNILVSESFLTKEYNLPINSYNTIFVSAKGGVYDPTYDPTAFKDYITSKTDSVKLDDINWTVTERKSSSISGGNEFIVYLFLGVSIVGIIAGILLIVNIYSMLAEERKSEMGTLRAIAFTRSALIKTFVYEGFFYSIISTIIGVVAGVGIGFVLLKAVLELTKEILSNSSFKIDFYTDPKSWILAFCIGLLITFGTSFIASRRISKINIVPAIRDIEDEKDIKTTKWKIIKIIIQVLLFLNSIAAIIGGIIILKTDTTSKINDLINQESLGAYLIFLGIVLSCFLASILIGKFLSRIGKERLSKYFVTALNFPPLILSLFIGKIDLFGKVYQSILGYSLLLVAGLTIVITATTIIIYNIDVILWFAEKTIGRLPKFNGIVKLALRYAGANRFRTGLTILMFALVLFLVSFLSVIRLTFDQQLEKFIPKSGYEAFVIAPSTIDINKVKDSAIQTNVVDQAVVKKSIMLQYENLTREDIASQSLYNFGKPTDKENTRVFGYDKEFLQNNPLKLYSRLDKFKTDEDALNAAIEDGNYVFLAPQAFGTKTFLQPPDKLKIGQTLQFNENGKIIEVIIGGYLDFSSPQNYTIFQYGMITGDKFFSTELNKDYVDKFYENNIFFKLKKNTNSLSSNLKEIQKSLIQYNLAGGLFSIANIFEMAGSFIKGSISILQGFLSFALFVGIAGISIIMVRSVNERKQQIGMLRSVGFSRRAVLFSFFLEASVIILLGIIIGILSGSVSAAVFFDARTNAAQTAGVNQTVSAIIPYTELFLIGLGTYLTSIIFTLIPSYQASRLSPVEATNYLD